MNRRALLAVGLGLLAAPKSALAAQDKSIPYAPEDAVPYYDPVYELKAEHVDSRIWPAVRRINKSGWVWTAESCEGDGWSDVPMLRLVCRKENAGRMLEALIRSQVVGNRFPGQPGGAVELRRHTSAPRGWFEIQSFVTRGGISVFNRFAERVNR